MDCLGCHIWTEVGNWCYISPPRSDFHAFIEFFEETIPDVFIASDDTVCLGDFNIDLLTDTASIRRYRSPLDGMGLLQLIKNPTHIARDSSSLIDHILVSGDCRVIESGVVNHQGISDHCLVHTSIDISVGRGERVVRRFRDCADLNIQELKRDLANVTWHTMYLLPTIDQKVTFFNETLIELFDIHAPVNV